MSLIRVKLDEIENTEDISTGFSSREGGLNPEMIVSQIEIMAPQDRVALQSKVQEVEKKLRERYEQELEKISPQEI